jgi:ankyrin repeat protein
MKLGAIDGKVRRVVLASDHDALRLMVSSIKDLNQVDETSMTPLLYAVYRGDVESCRILRKAGADPNFNPTPGDPLHTPVWHAELDFGLTEIAALLRSHGAEK